MISDNILILIHLVVAVATFWLVIIGLWPVAVFVVAVVILLLLQKYFTDIRIEKTERNKPDMDGIIGKIDKISEINEKIITEIKNQHAFTDNKIEGYRKAINTDIESKFHDVVKKILEMENSVNTLKRIVANNIPERQTNVKAVRFQPMGLDKKIDDIFGPEE